MEKLPITVVVAPFVDDVLKYKSRGYPWSYIKDMLVGAGVLSKEVKLVSFRRACLTNLYTSFIEQVQIPIKQSATASETARPARPVQTPVPRSLQSSGVRARYGLDSIQAQDQTDSNVSVKDAATKIGIVFDDD